MWNLERAAHVLGAELRGRPEQVFSDVSTDGRRLSAGALFVALRGPRFDAHDYLEQAAAAGAVAAVVERAQDTALAQLVVPDTLKALQTLAQAWREQFSLPLVAITGSNGKTTVKEMTATILARRGAVLYTEGNLNNDIGVPLTLLRLRRTHRYAVIELGANHPGEIARLTRLALPDAALITNAGPAHLEGFGSIEGVAQAKAEIYEGLPARGTAIVNHDDRYSGLWRRLNAGRRMLTFGLNEGADVTASWRAVDEGSRVNLRTPAGHVELTLPLAGRHNVMNMLAATCAALAVGATLDDVRHGLEGLQGVRGRLQQRRGHRGARLIDDTYNANPASLQAALEVLAQRPGRRFLALGDMGELGPEAEALHVQAAQAARNQGVERLYAVGRHTEAAARAFGTGGRHFASVEALAEALRAALAPEVTVLVKGSRSMAMERVVEALLPEGEAR
ncbi:UDP-N-acetylmuramoyl-tripeptide--D-alanyl-D-alanine ligase [Ectothiorhodospiraceae bacterium 2226]|nr:UDP-N-acetylmuramoyl-tripeptide--D-alanyl-D-alanine ligase [Ectothiorhodospiraceae bacterium 2226]